MSGWSVVTWGLRTHSHMVAWPGLVPSLPDWDWEGRTVTALLSLLSHSQTRGDNPGSVDLRLFLLNQARPRITTGSGEWDLWSAIKFQWVDTVSTISFRGVKGKIIDNLLICFFNYININYYFIICKWRRDPTPSLEKYHWEGLTLF